MGDARPESNGGFVTLEEWMLDIFNTVYEIVIFALVYGYTRNGREYYGSLEHTARWVKCSPHTVFRTLSSLVNKGYLNKREKAQGAAKRCYYRVNTANIHAAIARLHEQKGDSTVSTEATGHEQKGNGAISTEAMAISTEATAPLAERRRVISTEAMYTTNDSTSSPCRLNRYK
jgi:DNA-binding PadR family transcriptional regulator